MRREINQRPFKRNSGITYMTLRLSCSRRNLCIVKKYLYISLFIFSASTSLYAQGTSQCASITKKMGAACGDSALSMNLIVSNQCGTTIHANACFETIDGQWDCESDTIN